MSFNHIHFLRTSALAMGLGIATMTAFAQSSDMTAHTVTPVVSSNAKSAPINRMLKDHDGTWRERFEQRMGKHHQEKMARHHAELKEKLHLTSNQEPAWQEFSITMQPADMMKNMRTMRDERNAMRAELSKLTTPERLDKVQTHHQVQMKKMNEHMVQRHAAIKIFYAQLTSEQKAVFDAAFTMGAMSHHSKHADAHVTKHEGQYEHGGEK